MHDKAFPPLLDRTHSFPNIDDAIAYRDGLVAIGGDLSVERLLAAYRQGIFPWFNEGDPICWWATAPRMTLFPEQFHVSRSIKKNIRSQHYRITVNHAFTQVVGACANRERPNQDGTWITSIMQNAYLEFHKAGYAHSFEYWQDNQLLGGLYGVMIGQVFFGESMFSLCDNASKITFVHAVQYLQHLGIKMIDCQMYTDHLARFGASEISFTEFQKNLLFFQEQSLSSPLSPCTLITN